ncbi:MAG: hypothetical protein ACJ76Z_06970 [Thermoleophilaceae bacterium]
MAQLTTMPPSRADRGRRGGGREARPPVREPLFVKGGRAWINGREVGGTDPRFAHLNRSYD